MASELVDVELAAESGMPEAVSHTIAASAAAVFFLSRSMRAWSSYVLYGSVSSRSAVEYGLGICFEGFNFDFAGARPYQSDDFCGLSGEIDDALTDIGAAVVDADSHFPAVVHIGHPYPGAERQGLMGSGKIVHVKGFAICCCASLKAVGIV